MRAMSRRNKAAFVVKPEHVKLLRAAYWSWNDAETGAPTVDPKRPYGNSFVAGDVAEILDWEVIGDDGLTDEQENAAMELHYETLAALEVILATWQPPLPPNAK